MNVLGQPFGVLWLKIPVILEVVCKLYLCDSLLVARQTLQNLWEEHDRRSSDENGSEQKFSNLWSLEIIHAVNSTLENLADGAFCWRALLVQEIMSRTKRVEIIYQIQEVTVSVHSLLWVAFRLVLKELIQFGFEIKRSVTTRSLILVRSLGSLWLRIVSLNYSLVLDSLHDFCFIRCHL